MPILKTPQKTYLIIIIVSVLVFACQLTCNAAEATSPWQFIKNLVKKVDFTTAVTTEYDSNIFLSDDNENSDIINTLTQNISLKLPEDPYYLELGYTGNISNYLDEGDNLYNQTAKFLFSYRPFDYFSWGIGNYFKKMHSKKITTAFGDRLLSRGYKENTPIFEAKLQPTEKFALDAAYQYYSLDADSSADDYIDRGDNIANVSLNYEFWPELTGFLGEGYQEAHFRHLSEKDADSYRTYLGFTRKFESFNITTEVGQEDKHTNFLKEDRNTDLRIKFDTTYSVYNILNLVFTFNKSYPSARSEYFQYFVNSIAIGTKHLLNPKTMVLTNILFERQKFDSADVLSGNSYLDRTTDVISLGSSLRRNLNDWLVVNLGYTFSKRNTDFAAEGYTDHKVSLGLTASY